MHTEATPSEVEKHAYATRADTSSYQDKTAKLLGELDIDTLGRTFRRLAAIFAQGEEISLGSNPTTAQRREASQGSITRIALTHRLTAEIVNEFVGSSTFGAAGTEAPRSKRTETTKGIKSEAKISKGAKSE